MGLALATAEEVYSATWRELQAALERLAQVMPEADPHLVCAAGMGYFATKLSDHFGIDVAVAAIDAMAEHGHSAVLKQAETLRH